MASLDGRDLLRGHENLAVKQYVNLILQQKLATLQTAAQFLKARASKGSVSAALAILEKSGKAVDEQG